MAPSITEQEISSQPALWLKVFEQLVLDQARIKNFLRPVLATPHLEVILIGAGSSAFIGEMATTELSLKWDCVVRAVPTTDLVTHPRSTVNPRRTQLFVSYARSGNSPESVAAVNLVRQIHPEAFHLILTCNKNGALAARGSAAGTLSIVLPEESNDQGLAMTGSVSSLLLTSTVVSEAGDWTNLRPKVVEAAASAREVSGYSRALREVASRPFERVVCLGSGPLLGLAREAHLKVQELSDGAVVGTWDSFLGFRHGPRVVVNPSTLMLYFFSADPHVAQYEMDLVRAVQNQKPLVSVGVSCGPVELGLDLNVPLPRAAGPLVVLPYLLVPQLIGLFKSEHLGLNPDSPSRSGAIHRVVQGVNIYPWPTS